MLNFAIVTLIGKYIILQGFVFFKIKTSICLHHKILQATQYSNTECSIKCHEGRVQVHLFSTLFHQDIIISSAGTNEKVLDLIFT